MITGGLGWLSGLQLNSLLPTFTHTSCRRHMQHSLTQAIEIETTFKYAGADAWQVRGICLAIHHRSCSVPQSPTCTPYSMLRPQVGRSLNVARPPWPGHHGNYRPVVIAEPISRLYASIPILRLVQHTEQQHLRSAGHQTFTLQHVMDRHMCTHARRPFYVHQVCLPSGSMALALTVVPKVQGLQFNIKSHRYESTILYTRV